MEFASLDLKRIHILRVDPGEDVLLSVRSLLSQAKVQQGVVLGGYGTLAAYHLHWVKDNRIPAQEVFGKGEKGIEILSMNGLVVSGQPHIHVSLSTPDGAFGGHLEEGCVAYVLCEIYFGEVVGKTLLRERVAVSIPDMGEGTVLQLQFK